MKVVVIMVKQLQKIIEKFKEIASVNEVDGSVHYHNASRCGRLNVEAIMHAHITAASIN